MTSPVPERRLPQQPGPILRAAAGTLALLAAALLAKPRLGTRLRGATIWVADDPARTLLRIRSELFIGAVTLDLTQVDPAA